MYNSIKRSCVRLAGLLLLGIVPVMAGCSTSKPKAKAEPKPEKLHERGWIGGEYELVRQNGFMPWFGQIHAVPAGVTNSHKSGVLVTALSSNTPARKAGLREGDLILELNHQPILEMKEFRSAIDGAKAGTELPLLVYRDKERVDVSVPVGRESYRKLNYLGVSLPFYVENLDLWPNPGFSLWVLGYQPGNLKREELGSARNVYQRENSKGKYEPTNPGWRSWLVLFQVGGNCEVVAQEAAGEGK